MNLTEEKTPQVKVRSCENKERWKPLHPSDFNQKNLRLHINKSCTIKEVLKHNQKTEYLLTMAKGNPKLYRNNLEREKSFLERVIKIRGCTEKAKEILNAELEAVNSELDIMEVELSEDIIYLPEGEIEVRSISDILYYEGLYGKAIYEKPKGLGEKIEERRSKNVGR